MKRHLLIALAAVPMLWLGAGQAARASDYPSRTVTIVSPSAPGGSYTIYAQLLADGLQKRLGRPVIVENKPGAGTVIGTNQVAKAEPTGHVLLLGGSPGLAINVSASKSLPYDVMKEFTPVALVAAAPQVLLVNAELPIHSVADLVRMAKEKPGSLTFASNGPGTVLHLAGEMMKGMLGIDILHVPYKGAAQAMNDVAAGHVSMMFISAASAGSLLNSGKVRVLGVSSKQPIDVLPDVRPLSDVGLPGFDASIWFMVMAPSQTPAEVVARLHREINAVLAEPEVRKKIVDLGAVVRPSPDPSELAKFLDAEIARWGQVVKTAGLEKSI